MSTGTKIEWADATWNPIVGCSLISTGCQNCYAQTMAGRLAAMGQAKYRAVIRADANERPLGWSGHTTLDAKALTEPLRWRKSKRIFVSSMGDIGHETVPDEWLDQVFAIVLACGLLERPRHTMMMLTKRPARLLAYLTARSPVELLKAWAKAGDGLITLDDADILFSEQVESAVWAQWHPDTHAAMGQGAAWSHPEDLFPLKNLQLGVTAENQAAADERIPLLLATPAAVRFVSYEPALGPVDFKKVRRGFGCLNSLTGRFADSGGHLVESHGTHLDGIIAGGESGPGARPAHPEWFRQVRDQCVSAGVAFFFKQWGEWTPWNPQHIARMQLAKKVWVKPDGLSYPIHETRHATHDAVCCHRVGKKISGRLLDGLEHNDLPGGGK